MSYQFDAVIDNIEFTVELSFDDINVTLSEDIIEVDIQEGEHFDVTIEESTIDVALEEHTIDVEIIADNTIPVVSSEFIRKTFASVPDAIIVDDLVRMSTVGGIITKVTDNLAVQPVIGIAIILPASNVTEVLMIGAVGIAGGDFVVGQEIFLSITGGIVSEPPESGYVQSLGYAISETDVWIEPNYRRVKRRTII